LEEGKDILHDNVLDIDLVLVVQIGSGELDLLISGAHCGQGAKHTVFMSTLA
jgi:hypothetical protein